MKTTIAAIGYLALGILTSFGQASVNFSNSSSEFNDGIDRYVYGPDGNRLTGANWAAALYFGTTAETITSLATRNTTDLSLSSALVIFRNPTTLFPGTWSSAIRVLNGTVPGQSLFLQVRVWDSSEFESYDAAVAGGGYAGQSAAFSYQHPSAPTPLPSELLLWNLRGFALVPEPSTIAVCAVGLCGLMLFHGRK